MRARLGYGDIQHFAVTPDGSYIAVSSQIAVCVYQSADFSETWCYDGGVAAMRTIASIAMDPRGEILAVGTETGDAIFLEAVSGRQEGGIHNTTGQDPIKFLAWSSDGSQIASVAGDGYIRIWDRTGGVLLKRFQVGELDIDALSLSPDGKMLAALDFRGQAHIWDTQSGNLVGPGPTPPEYGNASLAWSPDSKLLAISAGTSGGCYYGGNDGGGPQGCSAPSGSITVWDVHSGVKVSEIDAGMKVNAVAFSPDGTQVLAGFDQHVVRLHRLSDGTLVQEFQDIDTDKGMAWLPDGQRLLVVTGENTLVMVDLKSGNRTQASLDKFAYLWSLAWSPDSARLATYAYGSGDIFIWDSASGRRLYKLDTQGVNPYRVAWSPDGKLIASSIGDGIALWDAGSGKRLQVIAAPYGYNDDLGWSPDGRFFAAAAQPGGVTLWDAQSWKVARSFKEGAVDLAWSPDGKTLAAATGHEVILWDVASGKQLGVTQPVSIRSVAWSADGTQILGADGIDGKIFNVSPGQDLSQQRGEDFGSILQAYQPNFSLAARQFVKVDLNVGSQGVIFLDLANEQDFFFELAVSPDGKAIAASADFGAVFIWNIAP